MQRAAIGAAEPTIGLYEYPGIPAPKLVHELGLDFVFQQAGTNELHCAFVRVHGNLGGLAHRRHFRATLVQPHVMQQVIERNEFLRRVHAA